VNDPLFRNPAGQLMYAVGGKDLDLYGLFANPDGSDMHWDYFLTIPAPSTGTIISNLASGSGYQIFVGLRGTAQIYLVRLADGSRYGTATYRASVGLPQITDWNNYIPFIQVLKDQGNTLNTNFDVFAVRNTNTTGVLYHTTDGFNWVAIGSGLPGTPYFGMTNDWTVNPKTLYIATDKDVYVSRHSGNNWEKFSSGLPRRCHASDLRFIVNQDGSRYLYLSTFGWSVWRARL
jgi:hypothetical protein